MLKKIKYQTIKLWFKHGGRILPKITAYSAYLLFTKPNRRYPNPNDKALLNKARVIKEPFEGYKIHGYTWGDGNKTILLLHGWNSHALSMRKFILPLVDLGFKVVLFDAPSHGYSEGGRGSAPIYRKFISNILVKYQPQIVIAHSLGGICTLSAIANNQAINVKNLVMMSIPITSRSIIDQFLNLTSLHPGAQHYFWHYIKSKMNANFSEFNMHEIYANNINFQGMIIHDKNDEIIPYNNAIALKKIWPNAELVTTIGLGHSGVLKDEPTIKHIIQYLQSSS